MTASVYGTLEGRVVGMSPDAITDERTGETFYLVRVRTASNALRDPRGRPMPIGAGHGRRGRPARRHAHGAAIYPVADHPAQRDRAARAIGAVKARWRDRALATRAHRARERQLDYMHRRMVVEESATFDDTHGTTESRPRHLGDRLKRLFYKNVNLKVIAIREPAASET